MRDVSGGTMAEAAFARWVCLALILLTIATAGSNSRALTRHAHLGLAGVSLRRTRHRRWLAPALGHRGGGSKNEGSFESADEFEDLDANKFEEEKSRLLTLSRRLTTYPHSF